jgi:DNA helicase MCM8
MSRQKDKCVFLMYLHVNSLANSKGHMISDSAGAVMQSGGGVSMEFSVKELYAIEQIHSEKNLFQLITG